MADKGIDHTKITEFIPYKTMAMDLESILANLTRMYVSRGNADMVELLTLSTAELFPIGSFDAEAERYEYVLKLAVPVKFHNHLRNHILDTTIQPQLLKDITTITAPYLHEFISAVFVVIRIEQDSNWRDAALDWVSGSSQADEKPRQFDMFICCAPDDENGFANELRSLLTARNLKVAFHPLVSTKERDIHHLLADFDKTSRFGVLVVSEALAKLSFPIESLQQLVEQVLNPGKRFCQVWDKIGRTEVANFSDSLARSLAFSTERMTSERVCELLLEVANLQ